MTEEEKKPEPVDPFRLSDFDRALFGSEAPLLEGLVNAFDRIFKGE